MPSLPKLLIGHKCLFALGTFVFAVILISAVSLANLGRFLAVDEPPMQADAIVVLGGEGSGYSRSRYALELLKAGYASRIILSGGTLYDSGLACSSAQLSLESVQQLGLPSGAAIIAPEAQSTYDEVVNLAQLAQEHGWRSLIFVTDVFHTRRVGRAFRSLFPQPLDHRHLRS